MSNKTIVITGASGGIGAAIAQRLGREGHQLVLAARRVSELQAVANDAERAGSPAALAVGTDVTKRVEVQALADAAIARFGGFDVWINNAGRGITKSALDLTDEDIDEMITINVKSALYGMQIAVAHFFERGHGQIINVSSFLGRVPMAPPRSAYNAAKHALNALTANARVDVHTRNPNIHITLVMPGMVATDFALNARNAPPNTTVAAGPQVQTAQDVAEVVADVIEKPVAEVYTNPVSAGLVRRYFEDVGAFEEQARSAAPWGRP